MVRRCWFEVVAKLYANIVLAVKNCYKTKSNSRESASQFLSFLQRHTPHSYSKRASFHSRSTTSGVQRSPFCIAKEAQSECKRSPFGTKRSLFSLTFVIPCAIHLYNPLNINNISKTSQNGHLNAPKIFLCVQMAVLSSQKCKYCIEKDALGGIVCATNSTKHKCKAI